ncbi:MAG: PilN domain-containing protein [Candidatus Omnitrophica bacterium]|nr:PilN domain-containing protein [Candidatus Omnitrophota bacterium]
MKSLFKKKKTTALLEVGKAYLKLALVEDSFDKGRLITKLVKQDLAGNEGISGILKRESFDDLIIILPRNQVTVRNLELPTTDPEEIKDIISIQAGKQTPFSRDEIIADFQTIGLSRGHYTKILLAIVQKTIINNCLNNLAEKKDAISKIVLGSQAFANWCPIITRKTGDETFAVLDIYDDFSDFCVLSGSRLLFTKLLHFARSDFSKDAWQKAFLEEVELSLDAYRKESIGPPFNKIAIIGMNPEEKLNEEIKNILAKELSLETLGPFEDAEGISISGEAKAVLDGEREKGVSFSKLIGLALSHDKPLMDFLPQGLKEARAKRIRRRELALTGILILLVASLSGGILLERICTKALLLGRLNTRLVKLGDETSGLKKEDLRIRLIESRINAGNSAIEVLRQIHKVIPQEIYITAVNFEENKQVSLRGTSKDMSCVFKLVKTLEELPGFRDVKTKYVTKRRLKDKDLTDFEITCPLIGE